MRVEEGLRSVDAMCGGPAGEGGRTPSKPLLAIAVSGVAVGGRACGLGILTRQGRTCMWTLAATASQTTEGASGKTEESLGWLGLRRW